MCSVDRRRAAAVLGAVVADAAAQPLHWIYDLNKLDNLIGQAEDIAFWEPSANPYYCIQTGRQSGYGDQAFVILKSLVENKGLDIQSLKDATYNFFGPESDYENPVNAVYKEKSDAQKQTFPIKGPWRHFSVKEFLVNHKAGNEQTGSPTDDQIDGVVRIVPVVAMYAGHPDMLNMAEEVIRVTQESDFTVVVALCAARILEHFILNGPSDQVLEAVIKQMEDPHRANPQELDRAMVGKLREVLHGQQVNHRDIAKQLRID
ncbi:crystallin J1A-like [Mizuhopecten yessoensis]|uniref:Crystallin J1C n=1 Tax=Mizuhopecten yessoensis TaxID=6573 RepID=A0A210Q723_MIZYE|nr:crystallin J1A-like [Mizuhopecten yessoensis]OWF44538.1 Crystallin J1C [Mizuhopecten yessoensis]